MNNTRVIAVTVTYNRANTLKRTVEALLNQSIKLEKIIVVDSNSNDDNKKMLKEIAKQSSLIDVVWMEENLGGAGGFYNGMKLALEQYDPDWYWIMDDDAYPTENCLKKLLLNNEKLSQVGFLAPTIYGIDNEEYQIYHHKFISKYKVKESNPADEYKNLNKITEIEANAFVGPLFPRNVVKEVGLPDGELFIYGDDTEYTYRISRKYKGYLIKEAIINHQDPPYQGKVVAPEGWWKEYYMFRNNFMFINRFGEDYSIKLIGKSCLILHLTRRMLATLIKNHYSGFRKIRLQLLLSAIKDGINGKKGRTIEPKSYIDKINEARRIQIQKNN